MSNAPVETAASPSPVSVTEIDARADRMAVVRATEACTLACNAAFGAIGTEDAEGAGATGATGAAADRAAKLEPPHPVPSTAAPKTAMPNPNAASTRRELRHPRPSVAPRNPGGMLPPPRGGSSLRVAKVDHRRLV